MLTDQDRAPELLADLIAKSADYLTRQTSLTQEEAHKVARAIAKNMAKDWGGQQIYFPKGLLLELSERDQELYRKFNGTNQAALAREYGYSEQWVYRIIKSVRDAEITRIQQDLFSK
jgi:Mor family transcriptional regulator